MKLPKLRLESVNYQHLDGAQSAVIEGHEEDYLILMTNCGVRTKVKVIGFKPETATAGKRIQFDDKGYIQDELSTFITQGVGV